MTLLLARQGTLTTAAATPVLRMFLAAKAPATKDRPRITKRVSDNGEEQVDWKITGALKLNLRAERTGTGRGPVYTITVEGKDRAENRIIKEVSVLVPLRSPSTKHLDRPSHETES